MSDFESLVTKLGMADVSYLVVLNFKGKLRSVTIRPEMHSFVHRNEGNRGYVKYDDVLGEREKHELHKTGKVKIVEVSKSCLGLRSEWRRQIFQGSQRGPDRATRTRGTSDIAVLKLQRYCQKGLEAVISYCFYSPVSVYVRPS